MLRSVTVEPPSTAILCAAPRGARFERPQLMRRKDGQRIQRLSTDMANFKPIASLAASP
jgi:hypothetical protein